MPESTQLTHLDKAGNARMVDISDKQVTTRVAVAEARVTMQATTLELVQQGGHKKGDVLAVARIAGIQAAKKCADLIPLCHPLALSSIGVDFELDAAGQQVLITATCKLSGQTGVEMEALTAASVAATNTRASPTGRPATKSVPITPADPAVLTAPLPWT